VSSLAGGAALGLGVGLGLLMVLTVLLKSSRPTLDSRVLPYVRDVPLATVGWRSRVPSDRAASAFVALTRPFLDRSAQRLERILGGQESVRRRLARAGSSMTVHEFRLSQLSWGFCGLGGVVVVGLVGPARAPGAAFNWLLMAAACALLAIMARDSALSGAAKKRERQMLAEFPVVADLLALSVAAGEGPIGALTRIVDRCHGALPDELHTVLAESRSGIPVTAALDSLARRSDLAIVARFCEGVAVAIDRGTPLVDVLNAQAADVRDASRRGLIETGARKEVAMMAPVVFLIMPVTLLFAFFPGVIGLHLLTP
jgi:tight adherence protein C